MTKPPSVRARVPWLSLAGLLLVMAVTLGNAAANVLFPAPTARQRQRIEQHRIVEERRARIVELLVDGDRCRPEVARELARALVFDGRSAKPYADDYARRCGGDPIVDRWGAVPVEALIAVRRGRGR
ncbi:MAG: hypothetical protein ACM31C_33135 [Acidobacteriota bacterium]